MPPTLPHAQSGHAPAAAQTRQLYIGLMSGTSLDGVDGALAAFGADGGAAAAPAASASPATPADNSTAAGSMQTLATAFVPFPAGLRLDLMALQQAGQNEIEREALAANALAALYAQCVEKLLAQAGLTPQAVCAIGVHGQTIRHMPAMGYTRQTNNPALLAELTGIDVIADFRSRDIAAGGQGAPLVPAFHRWLLGGLRHTEVVLNLGGIANISVLRHRDAGAAKASDTTEQTSPGASVDEVGGFDTGPANVLMDGWIASHLGHDYDADGAWAASGRVDLPLLARLRGEAYFAMPAPKSTGRDLFNAAWLARALADHGNLAPADVQATLAMLTASTVADAIVASAPDTLAVHVCGGGAQNRHLMDLLQQELARRHCSATLSSTDALGVAPNHVEALAFAWLAHRFTEGLPANLPAVTGARGLRLLGAWYPA